MDKKNEMYFLKNILENFDFFMECLLTKKRPKIYTLTTKDKNYLIDIFKKVKNETIKNHSKKLVDVGIISFDGLSYRQNMIPTKRFLNGYSLNQTAKQLEVSRERIRQIECAALERIKKINASKIGAIYKEKICLP